MLFLICKKTYRNAWEQCKLENVVDIKYGQDYKHLSPGDIPVYGTGGYMSKVNKALSYDKDGIGIGRKGTIDKPFILKAPFWTIDTLFYSLPLKGNNLNFIFSYFQKVKWESITESTGVPSLSKSAINKVPILIPKEREQKQIGSFFEQLDNLITLHQRKVELLDKQKKAFLHKMFPKGRKIVPSIRFVDFHENWDEKMLGEKYSFQTGKGLPLGGFSYGSHNPAIAYGHLYTVYGEVITNVKLSSDGIGELSKSGDILFPGSSTVPNGTAQASAIMIDGVKLGGDIIIARALNSQTFAPFVSYQINANKKKLFTITVGTTITHMYGKDLAKIGFYFPKIEEQIKIGSFINQQNELITLYQKNLTYIRELKKFFLHKLFI